MHYSIEEIVNTLGKPHDDANNTFTSRLLLLLEGKPIIGSDVHERFVNQIIAEYWGDYPDHSADFVPAFFINDILRLWRTFCVNYEAWTQRQPDDKLKKRRLKNYKLKFSRLLTCYSAVLYMLAIYGKNGTVSPQDAFSMVKLTPTQRLEWLRRQPRLKSSRAVLEKLLDQYNQFLVQTNKSDIDLMNEFDDADVRKIQMTKAREFGETMFNAVTEIGSGNTLHRICVV